MNRFFPLLTAASLFACAQDAGIQTLDLHGAEVTYEVVDGLAVFQGDIILGRADTVDPHALGHASWPDGTVPYVIEGFADPAAVREIVREVTHHFGDHTGVELVPRTDQADYVAIIPLRTERCGRAAFGRMGGRQVIEFAPYCGFGTLVHQLGHTLGLVHEETRHDRDAHVDVRWFNATHPHRFDVAPASLSDEGGYDPASIMHSWAGEDALDGCTEDRADDCVIVPWQGHHFELGQRNGLSGGDVQRLCGAYGNPGSLDAVVEGGVLRLDATWRWVPEVPRVRITVDGDVVAEGPVSELAVTGRDIRVERLDRCRDTLEISVEGTTVIRPTIRDAVPELVQR